MSQPIPTRHLEIISQHLQLPVERVSSTWQLLTAGGTVPFIARYRKEATGSLDELQIAAIEKESRRLADLEKRRETILHTIEQQGKLDAQLAARIRNCYDATELEDIYLPYKPKRRTRATMAREKGLEPLADLIFQQREQHPERAARNYLSDDVPTVADALQGARDLIAERINEDPAARAIVRQAFSRYAAIRSKLVKGKEKEGAKYQDYFDFQEPLKRCPSHRLLAIRRGETEGILRVSIGPDDAPTLTALERRFLRGRSGSTDEVRQALQDGYNRLLAPAIETEFRQSSKEKADLAAIEVFAQNLEQLLLAAPLGQQRVLGIDPGFRTGCKIVCLDEQGQLLHHSTIYPHPPVTDPEKARKLLANLLSRYRIAAVAVGNGTAGRETMAFCKDICAAAGVQLYAVNEAGASIYSASEIAREEFPELDLTVRGAISIARRLMDPLAELVKIDPKSIGVGQYQHDVNQVLLRESLARVIESCVNRVGINVNTASKHLLTYVSGLGPTLAQNIVDYRAEHGPFDSRRQLMQVPRMGAKAFEQCAGFLRIRAGKHPLDNTGVHPESYPIVKRMAVDNGVNLQQLINDAELRRKIDLRQYVTDTVGLPTLQDILRELEKPGLDPRGEVQPFHFADVQTIDDLNEGMVLPGIINNVTNFGAFVDLGIKESGLVHISQLANRFVRNPADVVSLGQEVQVKVILIDRERKRIQLSMKEV